MVGRTIGNYRIVRQIGVGGMGVVYEGVHRMIQQRVAIKVLLPEFASDGDALRRFFLEAKAISALPHPGLVKAYDFGQLEDGTAYLLMEYLDGETLSRRMQRVVGRLPIAMTLRLARQLAEVLGEVHKHGLVHRDLKPGNIFIVPEPEAPGHERIKLLDFGMAKLLIDCSLGEAGATHPDRPLLIGTPAYMSPEQCRGLRDIDGKADVYGLGVLLFLMVTGRLPFSAPSELEILRMHLSAAPPLVRQMAPAAPQALCALIDVMLMKNPRLRPTMQQVAERLGELGKDLFDEVAEEGGTIVVFDPQRRPAVLPPQPPVDPRTLVDGVPGVRGQPTLRDRALRFASAGAMTLLWVLTRLG